MQADDFKKKFFLEIGIGGGLSVVLIIVHIFVNFDINDRVSSISVLRGESAAQSRTIESLVRLKDATERAAGYEPALDSLLPDQERLLDLRADVRKVAEEQGIEVNFSFGQQTPPTETVPGFTVFQMTVSGEESRFVPFLRGIESHEHFISFDSIDLTENGDKFSANLGGRVFSR